MLVLWEVLLALVVCLFVAQYLKLQWSRYQFPPGPTPLPLIGNLWTLRFELHHEILMQLAKTYGNIFTVWLGQTPVIILNGCQAVRNGLISHSEELSGRPTTPIFEDLSRGKGVVFASGHVWKQQRRFGLTTLRNLGLGKKGLEGRIQDEARCLVEWFALKKGIAADPSPAIVHSVANVISAVVFGHRFSSEDDVFHKLLEANDYLTNFLGSMWARLYDSFPWLMRHFPGPPQSFFKHNAFLEEFVKKEIKSHKENGIPEEPQDLIDFYLNQITRDAADASSSYDEENLIRLVVELFSAGTETTTTTLRWALLHMVTHPDVQEKVQKELDAVLGEAQTIQYEDRKRLPYTNAVIHEIQRFSNIVSVGLARQVVKETTLQGFHIEKGTIVLSNLSSSLYDPAHWETPRQFNPGHFLDKEGNFVTNEAFLPFSAGHRVCLGELLARIELFIFFTSLLRAFTFKLPDGVKELFEAFPWLMRCLPGPQHKFFKNNAFMISFVEREVRIHEENEAPEEPQDFIDFYLSQIATNKDDANSSFDEKNMIRLVTDLFWAGMETTTTTLQWGLLYMMAYPEVQEKVQKELDAVLGDAHIIQYEDRKRMPYTNAVIHEIQRFSDIIPIGILRKAMQETTLQGFHIDKGTIVVPNLASALYDPEHWETPRQFNPNHFLDKEGNFVNNEAFLPFAAGSRVCLGEQLARAQLFIFFTSLLRSFIFRLPEGVKEVNLDYIFGSTLRPHPCKISAVPR